MRRGWGEGGEGEERVGRGWGEGERRSFWGGRVLLMFGWKGIGGRGEGRGKKGERGRLERERRENAIKTSLDTVVFPTNTLCHYINLPTSVN